MNIFDFKDYKVFLDAWLKAHPKGGRGQLKRLSEHLAVSTTLLSQVLRGEKHFSLETAAEITQYLGLREKEAEYFVLLVEHQRAGAFRLKKILEKKMQREQHEGSQLLTRLKKSRVLTDVEKMEFYSSWIYAAVSILSALPEIKTAQDIAKRLSVPLSTVNNVLHFLLEKDLCRQEEGGLTYGNLRTHIGRNSPFVSKHHQNWRLRGFQAMELRRDEDLFFTQPMAMSKAAAEKIRTMLPAFIEEVIAISGPSDSEVVRCIGIDWFEY